MIELRKQKSKQRKVLFMNKSIQHFLEVGVKKLNEISIRYAEDPSKIAEMVCDIHEEMNRFGCDIVAEIWENYDDCLHFRPELREGWVVERTNDKRSILTSMGEVTFKRTYFRNKETGKYAYLTDKLIGMESHDRLTEDAKAKVLEEAVCTSYRKAGDSASVSKSGISKEAVKELLHPLKFPVSKANETKRKAKVVYIDADEEHVSLQFIEKKGDVPSSRHNTYMPKMVYVYDGVEAEGDRHILQNVKYFGGGYDGTDGTAMLWKEVYDYIDAQYDPDELQKIYVNGDGALWIRSGAERHAKAQFVLDKFHMCEYILSATSHLLDSKDDVRSDIYRCIYGKHRKELNNIFEMILNVTDSVSKAKTVERARDFILGNWKGITAMVNGRKNDKKLGCRAEGHISHIYADRMSSRPLGWCRTGADKMARLRIYKWNHGDMLELVRYQKKHHPATVETEKLCMSFKQVLTSEHQSFCNPKHVYDTKIYTIPYENVKKIAAIRHRIYDL